MKVSIEYLKRWQNKGNKIAIFGAGCFGKYAADILKKCGLCVDCFVDNNPNKWGCNIYSDILCIEPQGLANKDNYIIFICISMEWYAEIEKCVKRNAMPHIANFNDIIDDIIVNRTELYLQLINEFAHFPIANFFYNRNPNSWVNELREEECVGTDRIAVYTGVFGNYDDLYIPRNCPENIDYYFISDERPEKIEPFHWIDAKKVIPNNINSPIKRNRYIKMHPHLLFPQYKYSIYIDGNIEIIDNISCFIQKNNSGISVFMHPYRECVFYEGITIVNFRRVVARDVCKQMSKYLQEGMPVRYGLPEMSVIARNHVKPECIKIMEDWWYEFNKEAQRDQLSFMYVMWKNGMGLADITSLGDNVRKSHKLIQHKHFKDSLLIQNN